MPPKVHDYSTTGVNAIEMIVRPNNRYGAAVAGERVRVDRRELLVPSTRECLYTEAEYVAEQAAIKLAQEEAAKPAPNPVGDAIRSQLDQVWAAGRQATAPAPATE